MVEVFVVAYLRRAYAVYASRQREACYAIGIGRCLEGAANAIGNLHRYIVNALAKPHLYVVGVYMLVVAARCQEG